MQANLNITRDLWALNYLYAIPNPSSKKQLHSLTNANWHQVMEVRYRQRRECTTGWIGKARDVKNLFRPMVIA